MRSRLSRPLDLSQYVQKAVSIHIDTEGAAPTTTTFVPDCTGTITDTVVLRGYLRRDSDGTWLNGRAVRFFVDATFIGTATTGSSGTSGRADQSWVISQGAAARTITAAFEGDSTYNASSATAILTCLSWNTKMATFNRSGRITDRTELKCRLVRSDNVPIYGKSIRFSVDGTFIIARPTSTEGYASYPYYDIPDGSGAGVRTITSEWVGDGGYRALTGTATLTVTKAIPYIWVLGKSVAKGDLANLYAYFRRLYDYKKQEAKPVTFRIDGTWIADVLTGSGASEPGVARYIYGTGGLSLGGHTVRCEFAGDASLDTGYGEATISVL